MDFLLIGCGSLARRRILPAVTKLAAFQKIHIASRSADAAELPKEHAGRLFTDYSDALGSVTNALVYISLPNGMHFDIAEQALTRGHHVIIDKPAVLDAQQAVTLARLAERKGLCLGEAMVWTRHPLAIAVRHEIERSGAPITVTVSFTSPPLEARNFRHDPGQGGGAIYDRGPYAVSCGRFLFGQAPLDMHVEVTRDARGGKVDSAFSVTLRYSSGILFGYFSLAAEYSNNITAVSEAGICAADRVFSPPADFAGEVRMTQGGIQSRVAVPAADSFVIFLQEVLDTIKSGTHGPLVEALVDDAVQLEALRKSAKESTN